MNPLADLTWRGPRLRSWAKNALLFVGLIFVGADGARHLPAVLYGVVLFSAAATVGYALNDVADRHADAHNPLHSGKRLPISGAAPWFVALPLLAWGGWAGGLVSPEMLWLVGGYLALAGVYTHWLKRAPVVELLALTLFFLIRVLAGTWGVGIPPSIWLVVATFFMALLLALGKRLAELRAAGDSRHRPVLAHYSEEFLVGQSRTAAGLALLVYCIYAAERPDRGLAFLLATLPFVAYGLLRYLWLVERGMRKTPEEVLLTDRPSLLNLGLWLVAAALAVR